MNLKYFFLLFLICISFSTNNASALSFNYSNNYSPEFIEGQEPASKSLKKNKKIRKNKTDKKFPIYGTISVSAAVLSLIMLGLGIFLRFNILMAVLAAVLAITALVMAIIGLKKGESRSFNFIGIMIGAVGLIGVIFFALSV